MNVLIKLLGILAVVNARQIEVKLQKIDSQSGIMDQTQYCATSTGAVENDGGACKVLMDADTQQSSDFDFISVSSVKQPSQINTNIGDSSTATPLCAVDELGSSSRCLVYSVTVKDTNMYEKCVVSVAGLDATRSVAVDGTIAYSGSKVTLGSHSGSIAMTNGNEGQWTANTAGDIKEHTCQFVPVNNMFVGNVEYHIKFIKSNPHESEVDFVQVRIDAAFTPSTELLYGTNADGNHLDRAVMRQHDALVLMGRTKVLNKNNDQCEANDGIDQPRIHKSGADLTDDDTGDGHFCSSSNKKEATNANQIEVSVPCSQQQRSNGDGKCPTSGVESYLVSMGVNNGVEVYPRINSDSFENIHSAYGVGISARIKGHFYDRRYKVIDQTGVETLEDNIGDFKVQTQGLEFILGIIVTVEQDNHTTQLSI